MDVPPESAPAPASKTRQRRRWWAFAASGALVAAGAVVALGPGAPWVIDQFADGQHVWRLGRLQLDGVSGDWLGHLRAERLTIEDEQGVWLVAEDVELDWRPQDIPFGAARIDRVHARALSMLRQPELSPPRPSGNAQFDVQIGDLRLDTIDLAEPVFGQAASFNAAGALDWRGQSLEALRIALRRTDSDADHLIASYQPGADYTLNVDVLGEPGGILARALGVPEQGLRATAQGDGDLQNGQAQYAANIGEASLLSGTAQWTPSRWNGEANARLDLLPATEALAHRIGASVALNVSGERVGAFTAHAETPYLAADLAGALTAQHELDGAARIVATTRRLSDIARESPVELGAARLEGELRRARGTTAIVGTLDAQSIEALGQRGRFTGPIRAALMPDRFTLEGDLHAPRQTGALFANGRLRTELEYDRQRHRFELKSAALTSDALALDAQGWVIGGDGEFSGDWRVRQISALSHELQGGAAGAWRAFRDGQGAARVWTTTFTGAGSGIRGKPEIVPQLLGAAPHLDGRFVNENGGITVSHIRVDGQQMRAGAMGRIVRGEAALSIEASARGPLSIGAARIDGAVDATGRLSGRLARPTLTAQASLSSFSAAGVVVSQPVVDFTLAPNGRVYAGRATVHGAVAGQPLQASSNVSVDSSGTLSLDALEAQLAALQGRGSAVIASRGLSANLDIGGALDGLAPGLSGRVSGAVALTPETLVLTAYLSDARAGELRIRAANVRASGPLDAIATEIDLRGRLGQAPLTFTGTGAISLGDGSTTLRLDGRGTLADADVFTRAPITASFNDNATEASLDVALGEGVLRAQWRERGRAVSGSAQVDNAPIAPLAAIWGERAEGAASGAVTLANEGRGLSGSANLELANARLAGRQRGRLNMRIVGDLDPSRLAGTLDATSTDGLVAHFEADAPVVTAADPIRIALAPERRGRARWSVRGPAASLFAAARLPDQSLDGQLNGEGELLFGAGYLSGEGAIELTDGRFEDKLTGIVLTDLNARIGVGNDGVTIENFVASGPGGGRLTATGGSANQRGGSIQINLENMLVANRPDTRARANGQLTLAWEGLHANVTGNLNILEANLDIASNPRAGIPAMDVIEINRPGYEDEGDDADTEAAPARRGPSADLDVHILAPARVFTRGRGVDAEWALNMRLQGTAREPRLYGEARVIRGTISLSGAPFEIDDNARIIFDGDPLDARVELTATRSTADLTAYLHLTGTARDPEVSFTSDPGLPEDEILPQILFGRSVEDLSGLEAAQLAASLAALSGNASLDILGAARSAAGLDSFAVRQDEDGGFLVAGGVYLTRSVYLEVARTGLGQAQTRVEWTIRPRFVLITSFLGNGDQRVSLRWRRESD